MYTIVQCLMRVTVDTVRLRTEVAMRKNSTSRREFLKQAGAGVTLIDHINLLVEYEYMDLEDQLKDAHVLWVSGAWRF